MLAFPTAGTCSDLGHLSVYCKTRYVLPMSTRLSGVAVCPKDKRDQGEGIDFNDPRRQAGADQAVQSVARGPKGMVTINCGDFETTHIHNDRHGRKKNDHRSFWELGREREGNSMDNLSRSTVVVSTPVCVSFVRVKCHP